MNIKTFIIAIILCLSCVSANAKKRFPVLIPINWGNTVEEVLELPKTNEYQIKDSKGRAYHSDLGILHKQFSAFWIPLYNYGEEKYVLFSDLDDEYIYVELDQEEIEYLQSQFPDIADSPRLPFWDAWGGKLLLICIILLFYFIGRTGTSKDDI